jgi:hypothetical protein
MRRLLVAVAVGGTTLLSGCTGDAATSKPSVSASPATSAEATSSPDPRAQAICDDLRTNVLDVDAKSFGTELGKMIAARTQGNKPEEARAQQAAVAKLNEIAGKLRTEAGQATDQRLANALTTSAVNIEKLAADTDSLSRLNSVDQVGQTTGKFATALSDIADYCGGL